jgi:N-acetylmuramoyl-L-alanine amidase
VRFLFIKHKRSIILTLLFTLFCLCPLQAQEKDFPRKGEGVDLFLKRHNRTGNTYRKEFIELNKKKLGKGETLRMGVKYTLPPLQRKGNVQTQAKPRPNYEPLFGKELASYKVNSSELKGACFYLVCGHGGPDPGAIGKMGNMQLHEDEYAYDIVLRLARNLMTKGANVHIIIQDAKDGIRNERYLKNSKRETCMGKTIPYNQNRRLQQRCEQINTLFKKDRYAYKRAIFVHVDSRNKKARTDVFFYHQNKNSESKQLAKTMKSTFANKYKKHQPGRGFSGTVEGRNLYVLRNTTPASVFVELGNIQNSYDQQRIILSDNRQALANWLCDGFITDYKRYKKKTK